MKLCLLSAFVAVVCVAYHAVSVPQDAPPPDCQILVCGSTGN